ncbi:MAG: ABC transporter ATP-binding protein [Candidatus Aminicenantes bacterium]|nr:ABC transporter ATP-binding protein [Candidatus Aminicenantes bacterium]
MIVFEEVTFGYDPGRPFLRGHSVTIGPGLTLVVGPNGAGKSSWLKLAAGVEPPDAGRILIDGCDLWREEAAARASLAYLPEQPDLTPYATIRDILLLVCGIRRRPRAEADEALARFGLIRFAGRSVRELSLGQKRKAVFAAAFIGSPSHLLLDEPLEAMDRTARDLVVAWVIRRKAAGAAAVVVSHDIEPFAAAADRVLALREGTAVLHPDWPEGQAARLAFLDRLARGEAPA